MDGVEACRPKPRPHAAALEHPRHATVGVVVLGKVAVAGERRSQRVLNV